MRVETVVHSSGDLLPILLDDDGLPIPSPNEFVMGRRNLSTNTLIRNLRELSVGNDSNLLIVFYIQIMPDDFVMQLHRF